MLKWETVIEEDVNYQGHLSRAPVPGGWVYKAHGTGVCFVPAPMGPRTSGSGIWGFGGKRTLQNGVEVILTRNHRPPANIVDVEFEEVVP